MVGRFSDEVIVLTYSGETYNFIELRADLRQRGHNFATSSDTEVVLRGYLEWGESVAERLNGMYAFTIWDSRNERLVMIRDRLGVNHYSSVEPAMISSDRVRSPFCLAGFDIQRLHPAEVLALSLIVILSSVCMEPLTQ